MHRKRGQQSDAECEDGHRAECFERGAHGCLAKVGVTQNDNFLFRNIKTL